MMNSELRERLPLVILVGVIVLLTSWDWIFGLEHWMAVPGEIVAAFKEVKAGRVSADALSELSSMLGCNFLHADFGHLLGNLLFFWIFGAVVLELCGWRWMLVIFLTTSLGASLGQILLDPSSMIPCLGVSGAVMGFEGAYLGLFVKKPRPDPHVWPMSYAILLVAIYWLPSLRLIANFLYYLAPAPRNPHLLLTRCSRTPHSKSKFLAAQRTNSMNHTFKLIGTLLLFTVAFGDIISARTWTNTTGKTIEAEFIGLEDGKVQLKKGGKTYKVPLASLMEGDRIFAQEEAVKLEEETAALETKAKEEARQFLGQELVPGKLITFEAPLSEENRKIAAEGGKGWSEGFCKTYSGKWLSKMAKGHQLENVRILLGVPADFDPVKGCPIFVQWTSTNSKSNVKGGMGYWPACSQKGWMLVSVEGAPDPKSTWANAVFLAGIKEFMEQLHRKYKGSETWPVAVGGFSGGSKICQWMGGLMNGLEGVNVTGYWLGGCNEARFDYAEMDLNIRKKAYRDAKVFISTGKTDKLVKPDIRATVERGCKSAGFKEVRSELYEGGHSKNFTQLELALDWFVE